MFESAVLKVSFDWLKFLTGQIINNKYSKSATSSIFQFIYQLKSGNYENVRVGLRTKVTQQ